MAEDRDIDGEVGQLAAAIDRDDDEGAKLAFVNLVSGVLHDLHRIAKATERLAEIASRVDPPNRVNIGDGTYTGPHG